MPRRTAGASRTSATSPSSTGVVPRTATTVCAQVLDVRARPTARTVHSIGPCTTKPPAALTLAPSTACSTSSSVTPRAAMRSRIELHLELAQIAAEPLDRGDAGHGEQAVLHLELGEVAQRHQVGGAGLGLERELEDLVQPSGEAREQRRARCPAAAAAPPARRARRRAGASGSSRRRARTRP